MKKRLLILSGLVLLGCLIAEGAEEKQAVVSNGVKESALATVTLTEVAEKHLAIATAPVESKNLPATRLYGGELVLADSAGADGQSIFSLLSQMTPADRLRLAEEQINADGVLKSAEVEVAAAEVAVKRAEALLESKVGSARSVDEAQARFDLARTALEAGKARRELLGAPVLAVKPPETLWVKVPVYVGDLEKIDSKQPASVGRLDGRPGPDGRAAEPVSAPPSTDPATSTVDLFYAVKNPGATLLPGQKVGVTISLKTVGEKLVVPHAAILYDIQGGTWVYQSLGDRVYARHRVQISRVVGDSAVLSSGPEPGVAVVTDGAAELFGTEFGVGK